jgi:hypothetical protein
MPALMQVNHTLKSNLATARFVTIYFIYSIRVHSWLKKSV